MIARRDLVRALGGYGLADWVLVERDQTIAYAEDATHLRRSERRVAWQLTVHHDAPAGRGSAHVTLDAAHADPEAAVRQVVTLARASVGPAWETQPAAAPARVELDDPAIAQRDTLDVAAGIIRTLARPPGSTARVTARVLREKVNAQSRQGLRTDWSASLARAEALVVVAEHSMTVRREARRLADLDLDRAVAAAAADLQRMATAGQSAPGPCALVLRADALLHDGLGVWNAFVTQADAVVERQGLTRYRERMPIVPGADQIPDPLTITSDGALAYGVHSAPLGEHGDAIRKFTLVARGLGAGLGLTPREAALRGRDPNGGVRNLVVRAGSWSGTIDASAGRVVEVRRLRSLSLDPYSGEASLEVALAVDHAAGTSTPVTGGSIRIDMIAALARARRSAKLIRRGPYVGPESVLIEHAELIS